MPANLQAHFSKMIIYPSHRWKRQTFVQSPNIIPKRLSRFIAVCAFLWLNSLARCQDFSDRKGAQFGSAVTLLRNVSDEITSRNAGFSKR